MDGEAPAGPRRGAARSATSIASTGPRVARRRRRSISCGRSCGRPRSPRWSGCEPSAPVSACVDPEGRDVGEVVDDAVSVLDGRREVSRFREVEVEIAEAAPEGLLPSALAVLERAGARPVDPPITKYARALGRSRGGPLARDRRDEARRRPFGRGPGGVGPAGVGDADDRARSRGSAGRGPRGRPPGPGRHAPPPLGPADLRPGARPSLGRPAPRRAGQVRGRARDRAGRRRAAGGPGLGGGDPPGARRAGGGAADRPPAAAACGLPGLAARRDAVAALPHPAGRPRGGRPLAGGAARGRGAAPRDRWAS